MGRAIIVASHFPNSHPIKGKGKATAGAQQRPIALCEFFIFSNPNIGRCINMASDGMKEEMQALSQQSEAVQRAAAALSAAAARARGIRLCLLVATVLLVGVVCYKFYMLGMYVQSPPYQDAILKAGQKSVADRSAKFAQEFTKLVDHTREHL